MSKFKYIATEEDNGQELRWILRHRFRFSSLFRTKIKFGKLLCLNGVETPGWKKVKTGDLVSINLPDEKSDFPPENIPLDICYEDDDLLIINKQFGVTVHPTRGCPCHTLANGIMKHMIDNNQSYKIRFVNRLDTDTSGLLIVAKNSYTQNHITNQMRQKSVQKRYKALVLGNVSEDQFTIDLPIGRPDDGSIHRAVMPVVGSPSITHVTVLDRMTKDGQYYSLVDLRLETGRTHQIRVHLSHIGYPIVGDSLYGGDGSMLINRQALHAYKLSFVHPVSECPIEITAKLPDDIEQALKLIGNL